MTQPFIGEIRMAGFSFAPVNWAFCNGQQMAISDNAALFNLIGTIYGGDGQTTFNLPNLQSRICVGQGQGQGLSPYTMGQIGGTEQVTLTVQTIPSHNHALLASQSTVTTNMPSGNLFGAGATSQTAKAVFYTTGTPTTGNMAAATIGNTGGSQPHENRMPLQCVSFIIALYGIYPTQQ